VGAATFLPISAAIGAASHEIIVVLLGERYSVAAAVVPFFAVFAGMSKMSNLAGIVCDARARLNSRLVLQAIYLAGLVGALLAVAGGPLWVYGAVLAGGEISRNFVYNALIVRKIIPMTLSELFKSYVPALTAASVVVLGVSATRLIAVDALALPLVIALVAEGMVTVMTLVLLVRYGPLSFLRKEILSRMSVDPNTARHNRFLAFTLKFLLGTSSESRA
jgi:lipopolysaccharide exporter